jgi:hypothetical protein
VVWGEKITKALLDRFYRQAAVHEQIEHFWALPKFEVEDILQDVGVDVYSRPVHDVREPTQSHETVKFQIGLKMSLQGNDEIF